MVVKALQQAMNIISPAKAILGRKQITQIAGERPRTLQAFMAMEIHGMSENMRRAHGPAILETLRQVCP